MSWQCGSVFWTSVSGLAHQAKQAYAHRAGILQQLLTHALGVKVEELGIDEEVARMFDLEWALKILLWKTGLSA